MTQAQKDQAVKAKAAEEAKAAKAQADAEAQANVAQSNSLGLVAINTIGNHKPGEAFTAKDKAAFDRFISLGAAKKA